MTDHRLMKTRYRIQIPPAAPYPMRSNPNDPFSYMKKEDEKGSFNGNIRRNYDIHHHERRLEEERARIAKEEFCEEDKHLITEYVRFLEAQGLSKGRLAKAAYQLRTLRRQMARKFTDADKVAIEQLVIWINNSAYAPWSKSDSKGWLKRFYRWLRTGAYAGEFPNEVSWIKTRVKQNELSEPDILTGDEVARMIEVTTSPRDKVSDRATVRGWIQNRGGAEYDKRRCLFRLERRPDQGERENGPENCSAHHVGFVTGKMDGAASGSLQTRRPPLGKPRPQLPWISNGISFRREYTQRSCPASKRRQAHLSTFV